MLNEVNDSTLEKLKMSKLIEHKKLYELPKTIKRFLKKIKSKGFGNEERKMRGKEYLRDQLQKIKFRIIYLN